jgi:hypothetical protein
VERDIFPRDAVYNQLRDDFVLVHQYTDHQEDPVPAKNLEKYAGGGVAVPLYFVVDSNGDTIARLDPPANIATLSAEEFATWLKEAKQKFATGG